MTDSTKTPATDETTAANESTEAENTNSEAATDAGEGEGQGEVEGKADDQADTKTDDSEDGDDKADDEPQGAPDNYEAFTLPEGFALEGDRLEMAHEFAQSNGWTQDQAQEGVNTYLKFRAAELEHERGLWGAQSEDEFGSEFKTVADGAKRALVNAEKERPGITERLDASNLGNHPDVLWAFSKLGALAKGQPMHGLENETATTGEQSAGARMYEYADKPHKRN